MRTPRRMFIGLEPDTYRVAALIKAGLLTPAAQLGAINVIDPVFGCNVVHLTRACTQSGGTLGAVTATEILEMFEANVRGNTAEELCRTCGDVVREQMAILTVGSRYDDDDLDWLAAAYRLTIALEATLPPVIGPDPEVVGEARLLLAQYEVFGPENDVGRYRMEEARTELEAALAEATTRPGWSAAEARFVELADTADQKVEWQVVNMHMRHGDLRKSTPPQWYRNLCLLFAAGATVETYATNLSRRPVAVIRYPLGIVEDPDFDHLPVPERGRSREVLRMGFETLSRTDAADPAKTRDWFDAIDAAHTDTPA